MSIPAFPFKRPAADVFETRVQTMFKALSEYEPTIVNQPYALSMRFRTSLFPFLYEGQPLMIVSDRPVSGPDSDYERMEVLSDFFQEEQRLHAKRADQRLSPWESWHSPGFAAGLAAAIEKRGEVVSTHALREELYAAVREATQFKPTLMVALVKMFRNGQGPFRVLDPSAGWGDRLLGAMAAGVDRYVGVDPNVALKKGHDEMIATFKEFRGASLFRGVATVIYEPFQTATIPGPVSGPDTFDLVFTSPPFFKFEIYSNAPTQSVSQFPAIDDWLIRFLFVSLAKAWSMLVVGGHMAIHIQDTGREQVCEPMNLYIQWKLPGARYCGVLCSRGAAEKPRPIWIWQKIDDVDVGRVKEAGADMRQFYGRLFRRI